MKKNIAIIVPKLTGGGAERAAANLSCNLSDQYNKHVVIYDNKVISYDYSGKLISINNQRETNFLGKFLSFVKRINRISKIKKEFDVETTVSFMENANFVNILSKKNDKVIISIRNFKSKSSNNLYDKLNKVFMKLLYNKADYIIAVSRLIKDDLIRNFSINAEKIKVIYNSYSPEKILDNASEKIPEDYREFFKGQVIVNVGRLEPQKGQFHLIKAFAQVLKEIPEAKLLIIGQGTLEKALKEVAVNLGVSDNVRFVGYTNNPFKYLIRSKLFVFPSLHEGFPNALCEAMACGLPVISSDCKSGPREILTEGSDLFYETRNIEFAQYGVLVPVCKKANINFSTLTREEKLLADSIKKLLSDQQLYKVYSEKSKERIKDFTIKKAREQWEEII